MSYEPYNPVTASTEDKVAWILCQILDDDAPLRWTRYRGPGICIALNDEIMAALIRLRDIKHADARVERLRQGGDAE